MKKNLIKMRVCLGFDCNPRLDVISYEDEVTDDGKAYQSTRGVRNEKTMVSLGQPWLKFDNSSKEPYWDAYAIIDASASDGERGALAAKLYGEAMNMMKDGISEVQKRFATIAVPDAQVAASAVTDRLAGSSDTSRGGVVVAVEEFKKLIADNVKASGGDLASKQGIDVGKWNEFYDRTLTPEILTVLMKGLPVLKFTGNGISFQTQEMYEQALVAVAGKVTSDVFARFVEETANTANKPQE